MPTGALGKSPPPIDPALLQHFLDLIRDRWGFHYTEDKQAELLKAIQQGCMQHRCKTAAEYYELLTSSNEASNKAIDELTDRLTIGETYFFRNQPQFQDLREFILPELIERRRGSTHHLHIWSAGSATGEEPYSLAIMLRELIPDIERWKIELVATDVNSRFLDRARRGVYRNWSFREEGTEELTNRYFVDRGDGTYQVVEPVRRLVRFQPHNLVSDPFPTTDLIVCRNVLIYFSAKTVHGIIDRFYDALTPGGILVLGHTESTPYVARKFPDVISHRTLAYRKAPSYRPATTTAARDSKPGTQAKAMLLVPGRTTTTTPAKLPAVARTPAATMPAARTPAAPRSPADPTVEAADNLWQAGDYAGAERMVEALSARADAPSAVWTMYGRIRADQGQIDDARVKLRRALGIDPCDVEANYLLSLVCREAGEVDDAIKALKQTIYLVDDRMALAQFDLGNIYADRGDKQKARRHWELARDILGKAAEATPLEVRNGFSKGRLLVELQRCLK